MSYRASAARAKVQPLARILLGILAAVLTVWALATFVPGYGATDEVAYDRAARAFSVGRGLDVGNPGADVRSVEFEVPHARPLLTARGRLVSKYPSGFPVVASLLYPALGLRALALLNAIALPGILVSTWLLGLHLLRSEWLALGAVSLMVGGTFVASYGRDVWPHAAAMALLTAGAAGLVGALAAADRRRGLVWAVIAGLCTGLALNVRVDAMLFIASLGFGLLLCRPLPVAALAGFAAGVIPGLLGLSVDNYFKWGSFYPFAYSGNVGAEIRFSSQFVPVTCLSLAAVLLRHAASLPMVRQLLLAAGRRRSIACGFAVAVGLTVAASVPTIRLGLWKWLHGTYALLFDLSSIGVELGGAVTRERTEHGSFIIAGGLRTGLLQDCPFLVLAMLPFLTDRARRNGPWVLLVASALFLPLGFGWSSWQGGGGASLRYFLPLLPLGSVAAVAAVRKLKPRYWTKLTYTSLAAGALLAAFVWWTTRQPSPMQARLVELVRSPLSTCLAVGLALLVLVRGLGTRRLRRVSRGPLCFFIGAGLVWSSASCLGYVLPLSQVQREVAASAAELIRREMTRDALVFMDYPVPTSEEITLAYPGVDGAQDAWRLIERFSSRGQRIFGIMEVGHWDMLMRRPEAHGGVLRLGGAGTVMIAEVLPRGVHPREPPLHHPLSRVPPTPAGNRGQD